MLDVIHETFGRINGDFLQEYSLQYKRRYDCNMSKIELQELRVSLVDADYNLKIHVVFIYSCAKNDLSIIQLISRQYPSLNINMYDNLAYNLACFYNNTEVIYFIKDTYENLIVDSKLFATACSTGNLSLVKNLSKSPQVNLQDCSIIRCICQYDHLNIFEFLYGKYQLVNTEIGDISYILIIGVRTAALHNHISLMNFILDKYPHTREKLQYIIFNLCKNDNLRQIKHLTKKYSFNYYYADKAFEISCQWHSLKVAQWFLTKYEKLHNSRKESALVTACRTNNINAIMWIKSLWPNTRYIFVRHGSIRDKYFDAVMIACKNNNVEILQIYIIISKFIQIYAQR